MIQYDRRCGKDPISPFRKDCSDMSTTTDTQHEIPIACDLTAIPTDEREAHERLAKQLFLKPFPSGMNSPTDMRSNFAPNSISRWWRLSPTNGCVAHFSTSLWRWRLGVGRS